MAEQRREMGLIIPRYRFLYLTTIRYTFLTQYIHIYLTNFAVICFLLNHVELILTELPAEEARYKPGYKLGLHVVYEAHFCKAFAMFCVYAYIVRCYHLATSRYFGIF